MMKNYFSFFFIILLIVGFKCENINTEKSPPPMPDSSVILFDIPFLNDTSLNPDSLFYNKNIAQKRINEWIFYINRNVSMAVNALKKAYLIQPEYFANETWSREYQFANDTNTYNAILYLTDTQNGKIVLDCYYDKNFSESGQLLKGEYDTLAGEGYLIFYEDTLMPSAKLKVNWNILVSMDTLYSKKFTNLSDEFYGFYLYFAKLKDKNFDIYIEIFKKTSENIYIYLNSETGEGKIKDFYSFNDKNWHCWDKNFKNKECETSK